MMTLEINNTSVCNVNGIGIKIDYKTARYSMGIAPPNYPVPVIVQHSTSKQEQINAPKSPTP